MIKISLKNYQLTLQEKITILGSRVTTSTQPNFLLDNNQLILTDNWVLQLVHTTAEQSSEPQLLEFPLTWEEVWPWSQELSTNITINYKKKPHIQLISSISTNHSSPMLNITLETPLEINLTDPESKPLPTNPVTPKNLTISAELTVQPATIEQQNNQLLEEKCLKLSQAMTELEERLLKLEEKQIEQQQKAAKLSGYVVDSFRLIPISKAILEFYQGNSDEPLYKLATNNQGYYTLDELSSGTYDIKVKHPRYLPLVMNSYTIANAETKSQDFLLKRI